MVDGKVSTYVGMDYQNHSYDLYQFVAKALKSKKPAFQRKITEEGRTTYKKLPLGKYLDLMPAFAICSLGQYRHSEHVELFLDCCRKLGLMGAAYEFGRKPYGPSLTNPEKLQVDEFNDVIEMMRNEAEKPKFKERVRQRERNAVNNYNSGRNLQDALFVRHSRMLVLRIDLSYAYAWRADISEEQSLADIQRFLNNRRGKRTLFANMVGHIMKREWGADKKFHFHFILYFDGSKVHQDAYRAGQIGEYWKQLTGGRGAYFNCNACKNKYKRLGIGMINHYDTEMRNNLLRALKYITKKEQFIHAQKLNSKVFRRGNRPAPRNSRAGRRRKESNNV